MPLLRQSYIQLKLGAVQAIGIDQHAEQKLVHHAPGKVIILRLLRCARLNPRIERRKLTDRLRKKTIERLFSDDLAVIIGEINALQQIIFLHAPQEIGAAFLVDIIHQPRMMRKNYKRCHIRRKLPLFRVRTIPPPQQLTACRSMIDRASAARVAWMLAAPCKIICKLLRALAEIVQQTNQARCCRKPDACGKLRHKISHAPKMLRHRLPFRVIAPDMCKIRFHYRPSTTAI